MTPNDYTRLSRVLDADSPRTTPRRPRKMKCACGRVVTVGRVCEHIYNPAAEIYTNKESHQ